MGICGVSCIEDVPAKHPKYARTSTFLRHTSPTRQHALSGIALLV